MTATKGSKKRGFATEFQQVQLILKKLVAPLLLCCIAFAPKVQPG
jgi:hypothetical protein